MPEKIRVHRGIQVTAILKGLICSFIVLILASIIVGFLFSIFDGINEDVINRVLLVMNYVAIFSGGVLAAKSVQTKGWLNGGLVGIFYLLIIVFLGAQIVSLTFNFEIVLRIVSGFLCGAIGGVIGVNLR